LHYLEAENKMGLKHLRQAPALVASLHPVAKPLTHSGVLIYPPAPVVPSKQLLQNFDSSLRNYCIMTDTNSVDDKATSIWITITKQANNHWTFVS
jgi:hypothetical protein